jgi:hypothetical protein
VSFYSIVFTISGLIFSAAFPIMLTARGKVQLRSAVLCGIATIGIIYGGIGLLKENGLLPSVQTEGGGTGGIKAGGGGGGKGASGGNGGTYIGGNQYNYLVPPPLPQPSFPDKPEVIAVTLGTNTVEVQTSEMRKHAITAFGPSDGEGGEGFGFEDLSTIVFKLNKNDELLISTDLYRGGSTPAVKLRDNAITDLPIGWDRNSSEAALEIVDEKCCPVFQFIRKTSFQAVLYGAFTDRSGNPMFASDKGLFGRKEIGCELKPIFKYSAWKYPSQYAP